LNDCLHNNINNTEHNPIKRCWNLGNNTVVVIDKRLVQRLGINVENTLFEQELTDGGIFLRIKRLE
jgi:hypothetical protein